MRWDVADFIEVLWSDLTNVEINQMTVVGIDLIQLIFSEFLNIKVPLNMNVLMGKNHRWVSVSITGSLFIVDLEILLLLLLIDTEEEV
jgi:hypothetical protein